MTTTTTKKKTAPSGRTRAAGLGLWAALGLCVGLLAGCPTGDRLNEAGCREDLDCGEPASAFLCEVETGVCYCRTNDACPPKQFCNTAGFCQDKSGCERNSDCIDPTLFCDTSTGTCLSRGRCTNDLHCPVGQVCDITKSLCVEGCRSNGDCPGISCLCGDQACACEGTTPEERAACAIGTCDPAFCADSTFCPFGQICGQPADGGVGPSQCFSDYDPKRRPYCDTCDIGAGLASCGAGGNFCLIDTAHPGNYYCGADCTEGQSCPSGYACNDVIVVFSQWSCSRQNPSCPVNPALPCTDDTECKRGGTCVKQPGQALGACAGLCAIDEGDDVGFCTCQVDTDCAQESCSGGQCSITGKLCDPADPNACRGIRCVDFEGAGGCLVGQNCTPSGGLTCLEVQ